MNPSLAPAANLLDEALGFGHGTSAPWRVGLVESGAFLLHHFLKRSLSADGAGAVVFLALPQPFSHYDRVLRKMVLKWLEEFSEKLHQRAKYTAKEVNGLLYQAEQDLKNTSNTLWNLSHNLVIDHKISDEDNITHTTKDHSEVSAQTTIPAQDYDKDILPRYKKALYLALTSCKNHLHSTGKSPKAKSIFRRTCP